MRARLLSKNRAMVLLVAFEILIAVFLFQTYGSGTVSTIKGFLGTEEAATTENIPQDRLANQIGQARTQLRNLTIALAEIGNENIRWPEFLDLMFNQVPPGIFVTSFRQTGTNVTLSGRAPTPRDVFDYRDILIESPFVTQVIVPSIGAAPNGEEVAFDFNISLQSGATGG